jgi:hypothetical protein
MEGRGEAATSDGRQSVALTPHLGSASCDSEPFMALRFMRGRASLGRPAAGAALLAGLLAELLVGTVGCVAPAMAMGDINTAQVQLSAAQTAEAPKLAPYEYTLAELYLERARDRMGTADYQEAYEYARKASTFARQAVVKAESHAAAPAAVEPVAAPASIPPAAPPDAGPAPPAGISP